VPVLDVTRCGTHLGRYPNPGLASTIRVVDPQRDEHAQQRELLISYSIRMLDDGLAIGSAGNLSVRDRDTILITPSGIPYGDLAPADICLLRPDGSGPSGSSGAAPGAEPSSETPMHLAVYGATPARAVVHTHSPEVIALSAVRDELPAIHYAIVGLGGPVRVADYTRFGSEGLARAAVAALNGRSAAILRNHGAVSYGATLAEAYDRALLLEWLARVYRLACSHGQPRILTEAQLGEVADEMRRRRYGEPRRELPDR
jgi:L-fuculose-phosphate aldolase